jgi:NAD-dependent deacetylase
MAKKIIVFSGAGLDAESGIKTFRDSDGYWEEYNVMDVASIDGWRKDRQLVLDFYNKRHKEFLSVQPNDAHNMLAKLESDFDVFHITQNVSDLLERSGCSNVTHLHGELSKMRAFNTDKIYDWPEDFEINLNSVDEDFNQLRPHIVWFGEDVPMMSEASKICEDADILIVVGSSLQVYPAANIVNLIPAGNPIYVIDPGAIDLFGLDNVTHIKDVATNGIKTLIELLEDIK